MVDVGAGIARLNPLAVHALVYGHGIAGLEDHSSLGDGEERGGGRTVVVVGAGLGNVILTRRKAGRSYQHG